MEITKGYKQTEVGVIPEDWEVIKIEDCGKIITGGTPSTSKKEFWNGDIPWITPTDIKLNSRDIYYGERFLSENGIRVIREVPKNTLLVTCIASIGKNAILKTRGACNQQINAVTTNDKVKVEFLYYRLEQNKSLLIGKAGQTATPILSKKSFGEILITLPPLTEQTAIAEALSDMDALIAQTEKLIEKKKAIKQGMMQELLTPKEGWVTKKLGEVCQIFGRIGFRGYTVNDIVPENEGAISLSPSNIIDGKLSTNKCTYISWKKYYESPEIMVGQGDIILVKTASIGKNCLVNNLHTKATVNPQIVVLKNFTIDNILLSYIISSPIIQNQIKAKMVGGVLATLSQEEIKNFKIIIPLSKSEQIKISNILWDIDLEIKRFESKLQKLKLQKQGMMQTLLTGKIRLV